MALSSIVDSQAGIAARLARFHTSHHARDLWPDIPVVEFRAAEAELARVAAAVLSGSPNPMELHRPPKVSVRALGVAASLAGVGALVGYWCETGAVRAEPEVRELLATQLEHGRRRAGQLRTQLERVLVPLADRGLEVLVLKGTHTRYAYFPDPGTRITSDVDLLVRPEDWQPAQEVLRTLGFRESKEIDDPEQGSWSLPDARVVHSLDFTHADSAWSIDLHRTLERSPYAGLSTTLGTPDVGTAEVWHEFSRPVRVLSQPLLLAYLALHTSRHFYGITQARLVELVLVARRDFAGSPERWRAFDELITRTHSGRFVFPALALTERLVPGSIDPLVLRTAGDASPHRLRRLVEHTAPASAQQLHPFPGLRERFVWIASSREAFAALAWLLWPHEGTHLASSSVAIGARWRRVLRTIQRVVRARIPAMHVRLRPRGWARRLVKPARDVLARILRTRSGNRVYDGPFRGMVMPDFGHASMQLHMLLGAFEIELRGAIERLTAVRFRTILNIGAAGGYYAVGLARRYPDARVLAFETLEDQRERIGVTAAANGVADRVQVQGTCTIDGLRDALAVAVPPVLVVADIEGNELSLFDVATVARLSHATVIIETHDRQVPGTSEELRRRFAATHDVEAYAPRHRTLNDLPPELSSGLWIAIARLLRRFVEERRSASQRWLLFTPLTGPRET